VDKILRVIVAVPGVLFGISGLGWIADPTSAAAGLGITLPDDGLARSTIIGDLGSFFLCLSAMTLIGVITLQRVWLLAPAMILVTAAVMRILAWAIHDAAFATQFIVVELVMASVLVFGGNKLVSAQSSP
jgi:hypothetical protein